VREVGLRALELRAGAAARPLAQRVDVVPPRVDQRRRGRPARAGSAALQRAPLASHEVRDDAPAAVPCLPHPLGLLLHVGHDALARRRSGVEQRTSATRSSSGLSGSCPMALTTGVRQRATARHSASSLKGSRSSTLPPPRAMTMTSTSGLASSDCSAPVTCSTARCPCTATSRTSKSTAGHAAPAFSSTSRSAALARP
jgi:hypothetical protein